MIRKTASSAIASLAVFGMVSETAAGGRAVECYEPVNRPSVYDTVHEKVLVSPGGQIVDYDPPIYGTRESVEQIAPARVTYEVVPAATRTRLPHGQGRRRRLCLGMAHNPRSQSAVQGVAQGPICAGRRNRGG